MNDFSFPRRYLTRHALPLAALAGLVLLLASSRPAPAADGQRGDRDGSGAKDARTPPAKAGDADAADDYAPPPAAPRDNDRRRPKPPRAEGRPGQPDDRQPGPPPGPDGPPRRPGLFGPGQPPSPQPGEPRQGWSSIEKNDPDMYKLIKAENDLDRRTHEAAQDCREASKDERAKLKEELKKLVSEEFATRQQRRKLELTRLADELKRLGDALDRREKNSRQIIDKRVSELLGEEAEAGF